MRERERENIKESYVWFLRVVSQLTERDNGSVRGMGEEETKEKKEKEKKRNKFTKMPDLNRLTGIRELTRHDLLA